MSTYERLLKKPQVAKSLVGMSLVEFDKFYVEFETVHTERLQSSKKTRGQKKRQRAVGTGRKHKYDLRNRLLMNLFPWHRPPGQVWLKAYTTYELQGFFYDLNKTNIEDHLVPEQSERKGLVPSATPSHIRANCLFQSVSPRQSLLIVV